MTLTQPIKMADLGRYLGKRVAVGNTSGILVGLLNGQAFIQSDNGEEGSEQKPSTYKLDDILPIQRSLNDLTEEEAKECFRMAFGKAAGPRYVLLVDREDSVSSGQIYISAISEGLRLAIAFDCMTAWYLPRDSTVMHAMTFNAVALVRYLDSIDIGLEDKTLLKGAPAISSNDWLTKLSEKSSYGLDDLQKAFELVNEKEKFMTYYQIAGLTGEKSMREYITRIMKNIA